MDAKEFLKQKGISDKDFMETGITDLIEQLLTEYAKSIQLMQTVVVGRSEQLKCKCKNAKFTRTVDVDYNPLCGNCQNPI